LHGHTFTNIETASASIAGQDPDSPGKINQDVSFHFTTSDKRYICGGVLDGHGQKGHVLNQYLIIHLPQLLQKYLENEIVMIADTDIIPKILVKTFEEAHYAARIDEAVPAARSGTTCVVTVVDVKTGMVYTSNVGDSRAIIALDIQKMVADPCINNVAHVMALSIETTTGVEDERKRIEDGEGRIDGSGNVWYGPVGIAMTRALGDSVMTRAGVISTPQVKTLDLMQEVTCRNTFKIRDCNIRVLIGSDGIFDVMSNVEANEFLCDSLKATSVSLEEGCHKLAEEARRKWQNGLPLDVRIDDTTVVALDFTLCGS
jgi:serine/threonine protein phosphatase PrpC